MSKLIIDYDKSVTNRFGVSTIFGKINGMSFVYNMLEDKSKRLLGSGVIKGVLSSDEILAIEKGFDKTKAKDFS